MTPKEKAIIKTLEIFDKLKKFREKIELKRRYIKPTKEKIK